MKITDVKGSYDDGITMWSDPLIHVKDDIISQDEADYIINLAKSNMIDATVLGDGGKSRLDTDIRSASHSWLEYDDDVIKEIGERISRYVGIPLNNAEQMQVIHYNVGGKYNPHHDAFEMSTTSGQKACMYGGQRLVTALVYLNKVPKGGNTKFPNLGITVHTQRGRMVVFNNTDTDVRRPIHNSLHTALPVEEGEKWAINIWFRMLPRNVKFSPPYKNFPEVNFI